MRYIKYSVILVGMLIALPAFCQVQKGYVKSLGRPDKKGEAISGVSVRVKGEHNPVLSQQDGTFSMLMTGKRNGDAYSLQEVQKKGYELNENGVIGRQYAYSDKVPLTIVMVSSAQLQADKQRIENNAFKVAEKNYKAKLELLERQKSDNAITEEQYRKELLDLQDKFEKYQLLIDGLAEHYAHVDYDELNDKEREVNICIENGDLEQADSLIKTMFDPIDVLKRNKEALAQLNQQISEANSIIDKANGDMVDILKQQEKDANYLYQLYTIALSRFDNDKAGKYIEIRAALDTTNIDWQLDAGCYYRDYAGNINKAFSLLYRAKEQCSEQNGDNSEKMGECLNSLGSVYQQQNNYADALKCYEKALQIYSLPSIIDSIQLAITYDNIGTLHSDKGYFDTAIDFHLNALQIFLDVFNGIHSEIITCYNNLAHVYDLNGYFEEARSCQIKALELCTIIYGGEPHFKTAFAFDGLGDICIDRQDNIEARKCYEEALKMKLVLFNECHPSVAVSYNGIGLASSRMGDYETALYYYKRALKIQENCFGETHSHTATTYNNIGKVYEGQDDFINALSYYKKTYNTFIHLYSEDHPFVKGVKENITNASFVLDLQYNYQNAIDSLMINNNDKWKDFLEQILNNSYFYIFILDGDNPARRQGMSGEYILLEYNHWSQDKKQSLFDQIRNDSGKPKTIIVIKDNTVLKYHFNDKIGCRLGIKPIEEEKKNQINRLYTKWKKERKQL